MTFSQRAGPFSLGRYQRAEILRFLANGVVATGAHYAVLSFGIEVLELPSAALANLIAALCGITVSFLGNRYFVFLSYSETLLHQALRFSVLYASIAFLHAGFLLIWTDWSGLDYRVGFLFAIGTQTVLSYLGSRYLVFAK